MSFHTRKRGNQYHYVCRVPSDLQHLFPTVQITQSLKTSIGKDARIAATAVEYRTQQLFLQLRTGMLPKDLERQLIAQFMKTRLDRLEKTAQGQHNQLVQLQLDAAASRGIPPEVVLEACAQGHEQAASKRRQQLQRAQPPEKFIPMLRLTNELKEAHEIKLTAAEHKAVALKLVDAGKQVDEAASAVYRGDWSHLELLRDKVEKELSTPYVPLAHALKKYEEHYISSRPNITKGSLDDAAVECRVLLEIFGKIGIADFNSMESVTKLQGILQRYPKNKQQRYGDRSIHSILKTEKLYEKISLKTANNYLDRAKNVVDFSAKSRMINTANVYAGSRFKASKAAQDERPAYDSEDIQRLIDAICTKPLWGQNPPYPERFWIILIALLHGFRLGDIVGLTKDDLGHLENGMPVIHLRGGKTKANVRSVAISDTLLLLGFQEWVEHLPRKKLFQDSVRTFGSWYNRDEMQGGRHFQGFESRYVTADKGKCLYSIRHHFAGSVHEVTPNFKTAADMMGHSTESSVTARYTKVTKVEAQKEVTDKLRMDIDLDRLEARATELFGAM